MLDLGDLSACAGKRLGRRTRVVRLPRATHLWILFYGNIHPCRFVTSHKVSVSVGDVDVPAIGEVHGWLGHTWRFHGSGQYRLYAQTSSGDAKLLTR